MGKNESFNQFLLHRLTVRTVDMVSLLAVYTAKSRGLLEIKSSYLVVPASYQSQTGGPTGLTLVALCH